MVRIVADTTCGLPQELLQELGIPLIPQVVVFGEESYHDNELDTPTFLRKLKEFSQPAQDLRPRASAL